MLKKLKLTCFRQHIEREFEFGPGLNAIKGANEAGKSTCCEAFLYFCFGANALRESLDDVVTYHQPVSKLRVEVELEHLGVTYRGYRGKSGAEISFGNEKVTGQRELTKFFERLFGADAQLAGKLMFASQKALAESLKAGPTEAGRMIEELANFDLIDRVAESIAARRPTGRTEAVEARIATLQAQVDEAAAQEDLEPLRAEIGLAQGEVSQLEAKLEDLRAERAALDVDAAANATRDHAARSRHIEELTYAIDEIDRALARPAVLGPTDGEVAAARAAVEAEKHAARATALHAELKRTDTSMQWDEGLAALEAEIATTTAKSWDIHSREQAATVDLLVLEKEKTAVTHATNLKITQLEGRLIKETTCALCQKDLTDVPEVVRANSDLQRQITAADEQGRAEFEELSGLHTAQVKLCADLRAQLAESNQYLKDLNAVVTASAKVEQLYARAADFIEVDRSVVPGQWRWTGPVATTGESATNQLALLERRSYEAQADAVRRDEKSKQRAGLVASRAADVAARQALDTEAAGRVLARAAALDDLIKIEEPELKAQVWRLQTFQSALATKEALAAQAARQLELTKKQLLDAQAELAAMQKYNLLIKKVRAARPVITNKLWNIVLGGVSKHFSEVRGQESRIMRADGIFKCNGWPVSGLSGSAEDMLGLAMRITLTKTFLPGIDMLQLDEPGSACSDAREARMLGLLATLGFGQIVLITHSDQADAFADRIVTV